MLRTHGIAPNTAVLILVTVSDCHLGAKLLMKRDCIQEGREELPQRVGVVKERCEAVKRLPLDNRTAIGREITRVLFLS